MVKNVVGLKGRFGVKPANGPEAPRLRGRPARWAVFAILGACCASAAAAAATEAKVQVEEGRGGALTFASTTPGDFGSREGAVVRYGKEMSFSLNATDGGRSPVTVTGEDLPGGMKVDAVRQRVTWTPEATDLGEHILRFVASNGRETATQLVVIRVVANRPPQMSPWTSFKMSTGVLFETTFKAADPDGDELSFRADGLPPGATLDAKAGHLKWDVTDADAGHHEFRVVVSDGQLETPCRVEIDAAEAWISYALPGVRYTAYQPNDSQTFGLLHGVTLEFAVVHWIERNDNRGPSHGRFYVDVELLNSTQAGVPLSFAYSVGFSFSVERNPQRRWLIPTYGAEVGGVILPDGHHFQATPYLGVLLWASRNLYVTLTAGYRIVPTDLERARGFIGSLGVDASLW